MRKPDAPSSGTLIGVFGTTIPPAQRQTHTIGDFNVSFMDGQIAAVFWRDQEVARGITYLLRDRNWATCPASYEIEAEPCGAVSITGAIDHGGIVFEYALRISPTDDGGLILRSLGIAHSDFAANRVGLTVLHPAPEVIGLPLRIKHLHGQPSIMRFPDTIVPSQPASDIAALEYPLTDAQALTIRLHAKRPDGSADPFEMEDQRNWGDASLKTYVGSLRNPWPFSVKTGDIFEQEIQFDIVPSKGAQPKPVQKVPDTSSFLLPALGTCIPFGEAISALENLRKFGSPAPAFVSAYLRSDVIDEAELSALRSCVALLRCPLRLEIEVNGDPSRTLTEMAQRLTAMDLTVAQVLACPAPYLKSYQPDGDWPDVVKLDLFYAVVRQVFPKAEIGGGMLTYFTELNRKWPPQHAIDFIAHSYCPIIHAADETTILQNVSTLPQMARTIAQNAPSLPYDLCSAQLSMRSNPYGTAPVPNPTGARIAMAACDPREDAEFAGLWMLRVTAAIGQTHARSFCLGALSGPASIYHNDAPYGRRPSFAAFEALCRAEGMDGTAFEALCDQLHSSHYKRAVAVLGLEA